MADLSEAELLHLVDRAAAGTLLADEAVLLREGIRSLAAARRAEDRECGNCEGSGIACSWCNGTGRSA